MERRQGRHEKDPLSDEESDSSYEEIKRNEWNRNHASFYGNSFSNSQRYTARPASNRNYMSGILKHTDLSPKVQNHMIKVYRNLTLTSVSAVTGTVLHFNHILPDISSLAVLGSIGLLLGISMTRNTDYRLRLGMLLMFGFLQGWGSGPLISTIFDLNPESFYLALVGSVVAFGSFSATALFSPRRSYLYLGGMLTTMSIVLLISGFFSAMWNFNLYLGLFLFCFYIIYDTQVLVERAEAGERDDINAAVQLFTDLFAIFVRLMIILQKQHESSSKRKKSLNTDK